MSTLWNFSQCCFFSFLFAHLFHFFRQWLTLNFSCTVREWWSYRHHSIVTVLLLLRRVGLVIHKCSENFTSLLTMECKNPPTARARCLSIIHLWQTKKWPYVKWCCDNSCHVVQILNFSFITRSKNYNFVL